MAGTSDSSDKPSTDEVDQTNDTRRIDETKLAKRKLTLAVAFFSVAAAIIIVFQILPAKFGIDLTGYGTYVGLVQIYETEKLREQMRDTKNKHEQQEIEIAISEELEYKVFMLEEDSLEYSWRTERREIYKEFHGEPKGGHSAILETYDRSTSSEKREMWTAPFEGTHG